MDAKKYIKENGISYSTSSGRNGEYLHLRVKGKGWVDIKDILDDYAKCVLSNVMKSLPTDKEIEKEFKIESECDYVSAEGQSGATWVRDKVEKRITELIKKCKEGNVS